MFPSATVTINTYLQPIPSKIEGYSPKMIRVIDDPKYPQKSRLVRTHDFINTDYQKPFVWDEGMSWKIPDKTPVQYPNNQHQSPGTICNADLLTDFAYQKTLYFLNNPVEYLKRLTLVSYNKQQQGLGYGVIANESIQMGDFVCSCPGTVVIAKNLDWGDDSAAEEDFWEYAIRLKYAEPGVYIDSSRRGGIGRFLQAAPFSRQRLISHLDCYRNDPEKLKFILYSSCLHADLVAEILEKSFQLPSLDYGAVLTPNRLNKHSDETDADFENLVFSSDRDCLAHANVAMKFILTSEGPLLIFIAMEDIPKNNPIVFWYGNDYFIKRGLGHRIALFARDGSFNQFISLL